MRGALVFDLDGTLIDSAPDIHAACARMLADYGHAPLPPDRIQAFVGNGAPKLVERVMGAVGVTSGHADWLARFLAHYEADPATLTRPYPGVAEALEELAGAGHALGLCTNKPEAPARAILRHFGMDQLFSVVIGGDSTPHAKPHPAPLLEAARRLGVPPEACAYVGDDHRDVIAGRAAGMATVAAGWGYLGAGEAIGDWGADIVIDAPHALLHWLELA